MKKTSTKASASKKKLPKIKDLTPKKNPRGGSSAHDPTGGGKKGDY